MLSRIIFRGMLYCLFKRLEMLDAEVIYIELIVKSKNQCLVIVFENSIDFYTSSADYESNASKTLGNYLKLFKVTGGKKYQEKTDYSC